MANSPGTYQQSGPSAPQTARAVLFEGPAQQKGFWDNPAKLTTALAGANNDLLIQAKATGEAGNAITVAYVVSGASTPLSVSVTGNAITVNVATDGSSNPTSTAAQVAAAIAASGPANALVTAVNAPGNDGTGVVAALTATPLAGGSTSSRGPQSDAPLPHQHPIHDVYATR